MKRLRIGLPPLDELTTESQVQFAWLDRAGQVSQQGQGSLAQLANNPAAFFLHPRDSLLTSLELPQLPSAKVDDAVTCAAQALILGSLELMHVAHGPRESSGRVQVGWLPKSSLEHLGWITTQLKIKVRGLYPAPYALPVSEPPSAAFSRSRCSWVGAGSSSRGTETRLSKASRACIGHLQRKMCGHSSGNESDTTKR